MTTLPGAVRLADDLAFAANNGNELEESYDQSVGSSAR
jgi:hypothetical protein